MTTREDWFAWYEEIKAFRSRDTEGFTRDLMALEAHIKKLTELCPKDEAGWPLGTALNVIDRLTADYNRFKKFLNLTSE